ncbi:MAG: restriction endonuclease [Phycisphaerales bacterium]
MSKPKAWRVFERVVQEAFSGMPGAKVHRDFIVRSTDGKRNRKLEILIEYPVLLPLTQDFQPTVVMKIAVDCKDHKRPASLADLAALAEQMNDIGAPIGIMVATAGFGGSVRERAKQLHIYPVEAFSEVMALMKGRPVPDFWLCKCCKEATAGKDRMPGAVDWHDQMMTRYEAITGSCTWCNSVHALCPDCGSVTGFHEADEGEWIECNGGCDRLYFVHFDGRENTRDLITVSPMERRIVRTCEDEGGSIDGDTATKMLKYTMWEYATDAVHPVAALTKRGWVEEVGEGGLRLTDEGRTFVEDDLPNARNAYGDW